VENLERKDVDSLFVGSALVDRLAFQAYPAPVVAEQMGLTPTKMAMRTEMACVSGQAAIRAAYTSIASGMSDIAVVVGIEKMNIPNLAETQVSMAAVLDREWEGVNGLNAPPYFALVAQRHMHEYGTTAEQMAAVKAKNAGYATSNWYAHFQKPVTVEKVLKSPMVSPPLHLLDCSGITDGAAAVVLTHGDIAKQFTDTPVYIKGLGQATQGSLVVNLQSLTTWHPLKHAARDALKMAGIGLKDLDLAETHDCFTISEIIEYEDLGLCKKGEGGKFVEDGQAQIGGTLPVNVRGGLLACGHPLGATGVAQPIEITQQFLSQVPDERAVGGEWGLCHNLSGNANNHAVMVLHRGS
jgi:acetyl-CoA C-acetyltransferase